MDRLEFYKMHSLGNDFVIIDAREVAIELTRPQISWLCDRHLGVGCDQLLVLQRAVDAGADLSLVILDKRGERLLVCSNGARCVSWLYMKASGRRACTVETAGGAIHARLVSERDLVSIEMAQVQYSWSAIPLAQDVDTLAVPLQHGSLSSPTCNNVGNSHATFFVDDVDGVALDEVGPALDSHPLFGRRTNIGVAAVVGPDQLRLRVWEPAAGVTLCCGSGACAAAVAAARRGLTGRRVEVCVKHGSLFVEWAADGRLYLTGPVCLSFVGSIDMTASDAAPEQAPCK
jgi:diaminopimelate epimerase